MKRPQYPMPDFVRDALEARGLTDSYNQSPPYQRNDYVGWITRAKREETRRRRLEQMLDELDHGGLYMNMPYRPSKRSE